MQGHEEAPFVFMGLTSAKKSLSKLGPNTETPQNVMWKCEEMLTCRIQFAMSPFGQKKEVAIRIGLLPTLSLQSGLAWVPVPSP